MKPVLVRLASLETGTVIVSNVVDPQGRLLVKASVTLDENLNPSFVKNRRISEKTAFFPFEVGSSPGSLF